MASHNWVKNRENYQDDKALTDSYWDEPNVFQLNVGIHNGPRCKDCGLKFCMYCQKELWESDCNRNLIYIVKEYKL